jgi:hypothetical protein
LPPCRHSANIALPRGLAGVQKSMSMTTYTSLYLAPRAPLSAPELSLVRQVLRDLEVIGRALQQGVYSAGDGFSRHVVYAGCSPHLVLEPPADGGLAFCHVALHGPYPAPRLVTGPNTVKPRCPACRTRFADWQVRLADWRAGEPALCAGCGRAWAAHELDWRGQAVSGRVLLELRNVFPGEATPSDRLLHALEGATGEGWGYAWAGYLSD